MTFEVASFGGSLFSGGRYFQDLLTPAKFYRYFRRVATCTLGGHYFEIFTVLSKALSNRFCVAGRFVCIFFGIEFVHMLQIGNGIHEVNSVFVFLFDCYDHECFSLCMGTCRR